MPDVSEQLQAMRSLPQNWDGYGAASPNQSVLGIAGAMARFLDALLARSTLGASDFRVSPTRNGGVLFEWHDNAAEHEIEIGPDERISFLHSDKATGEITTRLFAPVSRTVIDPNLLNELGELLEAA